LAAIEDGRCLRIRLTGGLSRGLNPSVYSLG
jgi:hypothetical protein